LGEVPPPVGPVAQFGAACDVVRRLEFHAPLHQPEVNSAVPPRYLSVQSFEAEPANDYLTLDGVLGNLSEDVTISIRVEPVDLSTELAAHTKYLALLAAINRGWTPSRDDSFVDYLGGRNSRRLGAGGFGHARCPEDPLADVILHGQRRFQETLCRPHLRFQIRVLAETGPVAHMAASLVAESAFRNGSYQLVDSCRKKPTVARLAAGLQDSQVLTPPAEALLPAGEAVPLYHQLAGLVSAAPVEELGGAFHLPVAAHSSPRCIRKNTDPPAAEDRRLIVIGHDQELTAGFDNDDATGAARGVLLEDLAEHVEIIGLPGKGKTSAVQNMVIQAIGHDVPVMIIETAKTEYRVMKAFQEHPDAAVRSLAESLEVYTVGNEAASPLRLNPLEVPADISPDEHVEHLLACFKAAMPLFGPLPGVLADALEEVLSERPTRDKPPVVQDLVCAAERVLSAKGYSGDVHSDVRAALDVRLGTLTCRLIGSLFRCRRSVPSVEHLMSVPSVIELDRLEVEQACLVMLFLFTRIREHLRLHPWSGPGIRLLIIVEEAHNLVGCNTDTSPSENSTDPKAHAAEYVCRMLAELRALGVGMVIVDQSPSSLAPQVTRSVATKLTFLQVANDDRAEIGGAMLFGPTEMEDVARLQTGEAFFITEGYHGPRRIRTVNIHRQLGRRQALDDRSLLGLIQDEKWFRQAATVRRREELAQLEEKMDALQLAATEARALLKRLLDEPAKILRSSVDRDERRRRSQALARRACSLQLELASARDAFVNGPYRKLLGDLSEHVRLEQGIQDKRAELVQRYKHSIEPLIDRCRTVIMRLANRCRQLQR